MKDDYTILVLYWKPAGSPMRAAIRHHLRAAGMLSRRGRVVYVNAFPHVPRWIRWMRFDAVLLHTTLLCLRWSNELADYRWKLRWVRDLNCPKIAIPQDEYDHSELLDEWLADWNVEAILSNFVGDQTAEGRGRTGDAPDPLRELLYPINARRARFYKVLTGYVDEPTARECAKHDRPLPQREHDLVYRACHLPFWFGRHGELKHRIAEVVRDRAGAMGLRCDISTRPEDTIQSDEWFRFLSSSRGTIGVESGSSVLDRRGEIQAAIRNLLADSPELSLRDLDAFLPAGWDDYRFFAISPRHFEAVLTGTCQLLVEGDYDGCLEADRHYIPLKRDFSNLGAALERLRDHRRVQEMTRRAYEDVYRSGRYGYDRFASVIAQAIEDARSGAPRGLPVVSGAAVQALSRASTTVKSGAQRCGEAAHSALYKALRGAARLARLVPRAG